MSPIKLYQLIKKLHYDNFRIITFIGKHGAFAYHYIKRQKGCTHSKGL